MEERILVVDDEKSIADAICYALRREGYAVNSANDGSEALEKAQLFKPDAIILDVMMPGLNGYDVIRKLENRNKMGIIMLTAKNDIVDKVLGLELGADDYLTKPFDMRELMARVKSLLRRLQKGREEKEPGEIHMGNLVVNIQQRKVLVKGSTIDFTPKEFDLLALLISNPERVYTRDELLDLVWDMDYAGGTRTVDIHVQRIRKKLGDDLQDVLQTVHGVGYKGRQVDYENKYQN